MSNSKISLQLCQLLCGKSQKAPHLKHPDNTPTWIKVGIRSENNLYYLKFYGVRMEVLNPTQLHLLKMFSFAKDSKSLEEIRVALMDIFAKRVEKDMDDLWDSGKWDNDKNNAVLNEHLRTPYKTV